MDAVTFLIGFCLAMAMERQWPTAPAGRQHPALWLAIALFFCGLYVGFPR
jgi:hypothetical protein